jgi:hypothetical protein
VVGVGDAIVFFEERVDVALCSPATVLRAFGRGGDERGFSAVDVAWFEEDLQDALEAWGERI